MTDPKPRDRIIRPISPEVRARLAALKSGEQPAGSAIPEHARAAIAAGNVVQVVIFCDYCAFQWEGDVIGETRTERFDAARAYLASDLGWRISDDADLCPTCAA